MGDNINNSISQEIKSALNNDLNLLHNSITTNKTTILEIEKSYSIKLKEINTLFDDNLHQLELNQKKFFVFNGVKHFFFWFSQVVSCCTLGLLIYFLFFR